MKRSAAEIVREYGPTGVAKVNGSPMTAGIWFAAGKLHAIDPASRKMPLDRCRRARERPRRPAPVSQIAEDRQKIDPKTAACSPRSRHRRRR
jgi:hypothetical protein